MGLKKKTINLVKKVLNNNNKRAMYTPGEILYMEMQLKNLIEERKRRVKQRKLEKGFGTDV